MSHHTTHPNLTKYVRLMNIWNEHFGHPTIRMPFFTEADRHRVAERLECDFSPENLTCDGELAAADVTARLNYLNAVKAELETFK